MADRPIVDGAGVLTRELHVRVIDVSRSGCLVESESRLEVGFVGRLRLRLGAEEYGDAILVVRCQEIQGAGPRYRVGLRFLTTPRQAGSIRYAVARRALKEAAGPPTLLM